jgi:hypothetical protein
MRPRHSGPRAARPATSAAFVRKSRRQVSVGATPICAFCLSTIRHLARNASPLIQMQIDSILIDFDSSEIRIRPAL